MCFAPCRAFPCCAEKERCDAGATASPEPLPEPQPVLPRRSIGCACYVSDESPGVFCLQEERKSSKCCCPNVSAEAADKLPAPVYSLGNSLAPSFRGPGAANTGTATPEFGAFQKDSGPNSPRPNAIGKFSPRGRNSPRTPPVNNRRASFKNHIGIADDAYSSSQSPQKGRVEQTLVLSPAERRARSKAGRRDARKGSRAHRRTPEPKDETSSSSDSSSEEDPYAKYYFEEVEKNDWDSMLLISCYLGDVKTAKMCLEAEALPEVEDARGLKAGFHAAMSGSMETLKLILEFDTHFAYAHYFDCSVTVDKMSPLMTFIRHGLTDIYSFLVHEYGCRLRLIGDRFADGVGRSVKPGMATKEEGQNGLGAPLDRWLALVPELTHPSHISKRRPLELGYRRILPNHVITPEEFVYLQKQRIYARKFLRTSIVGRQQKIHHSQINLEDDEKYDPASRRWCKRDAIKDFEEFEEHVNILTAYDCVAVMPANRSSRSARSARPSARNSDKSPRSPRGGKRESSPREQHEHHHDHHHHHEGSSPAHDPAHHHHHHHEGSSPAHDPAHHHHHHHDGDGDHHQHQHHHHKEGQSPRSPRPQTSPRNIPGIPASASPRGAAAPSSPRNIPGIPSSPRAGIPGSSPRGDRVAASSPRGDRVAPASPSSPRSKGAMSPRSKGSGTSPRSHDYTRWCCGNCEHWQKSKGLSTISNIPCEKCHKINQIRANTADNEEAAPDSDGGEYWVNAGEEFLPESIVTKYMPVFKKSQFWFLGPQRLRELIRVVHVAEIQKERVIFREGEPLDALYVLKSGQVLRTSQAPDNVDHEMLTVETSQSERHHAPVLVLDYRAYMGSGGVFLSTITVRSAKADVFVFSRSDIAEHCGDESLERIVLDSQSHAVLDTVPIFKIAFSEREAYDIGRQLEYRECKQGTCLVKYGARLGHVFVVQRGKLQINDGENVKTVYVSPEKVNVTGSNESWMPIFALGVRLLLYDLCSTANVEVTSKLAEVWVMDVRSSDQVLRENGNLLHHLQIATYVMYLIRVKMFRNLNLHDPRLRNLIIRSQTMEYWVDENIITQGDVGDCLYILVEGTVSVMVGNKQVASITADIDHDKVHFFGELALLDQAPRGATVKVRSQSASALRVGIEAIEDSFGSLEMLLSEQGFTREELLASEQAKLAGKKTSVTAKKSFLSSAQQ
mmetsp:Transcript_39639/g.73468  ORF Transcript_39639/g.73468 Transcript_39639/m.73468 type:complete len:1185 (-) Transcript_39639:38-3592(-)